MTTVIAGIERKATMTDASMHDALPTAPGTPAVVRVWDPYVRLFHWTLVAAFAVAWLSAEESSELHEVAGYAVAALLAFRVVWGLIGSRYARFGQFVKGPGETLSYLGAMTRGKERRHLGHNPAGAAMILALLVALAGTAWTGWKLEEADAVAMTTGLPQIVATAMADDDEGGERGQGGESAMEELHEVFANLALVLIGLHVAGVALASVRHRENLPRAMVTGDKRAAGPGDIA